MSEYGAAIDEARAEYGSAMPDFMPDVCTVSVPGVPTTNRGQFVEGTPTTTANVPCSYETLNAYEKQAGGAVTANADHKLELPVIWQGAYLNVPPSATIDVAARGVNPALSFSVTGPLPSSTSMKQRIAATLRG